MMASQVQTIKMYILLISIFSILVQSVQSQDEADESMEEDNQNDSSVPDLLQDFPSTKQKESAFYANEQIFQLKPTIKGSEKFKANIFTLPNGFELILHEDALLSEPRKCLKAVTINLADYKSDAQRIIQAYADPFFWGAVICELYVIWNPVIIYNRKNEDTETNEEKEHYAVLSHKERVVELFNFFLKQNIPQLFLEGAWTDFIAPILEEASNDYSVSAIILYPSFDDSRHFKAVSTDLFETYRSELLLRLWNLNQFRHIVAVEAGFLYAMISATLESQHGFWEPGWDTDVAHGWHEIKKKNPFYVWESEMDEKKSVSTQAASAGASSKVLCFWINQSVISQKSFKL